MSPSLLGRSALPALSIALAAASWGGPAAAQLKPPRSTPPAAAAKPAEAPADTAANAEKAKAGALAASGWLLLLDRRDWGRAWESSSPVFRSAVPLAGWMDGIPKLRQPLGALAERQQADAVYKTSLQGRPDGDYVTVVFDSKFEAKAVQETVTTVRDPDGKWRVTGYSVQ